jgi:hypothetical protein
MINTDDQSNLDVLSKLWWSKIRNTDHQEKSGMLPVGFDWIHIFRNGSKKVFETFDTGR